MGRPPVGRPSCRIAPRLALTGPFRHPWLPWRSSIPGYSFRSSDFRSQPDRWKQGRRSSAAVPATPTEGQRYCARGIWCAASVIVTEGKDIRREAALGYQAFCPRDTLSVGRWLDELPAQYVYLAAELGKPSARGALIRVPFGPRIGLRVDVDALMRAITESLCSWHERVAAIDHLTFPEDRRRDMYAVQRAVDVIGGERPRRAPRARAAVDVPRP